MEDKENPVIEQGQPRSSVKYSTHHSNGIYCCTCMLGVGTWAQISNMTLTNMEANLNEKINILPSKKFDIKAFKTIIKGYAGALRQCLETGQKIFFSLVTLLCFEERLVCANQITKHQKGEKR